MNAIMDAWRKWSQKQWDGWGSKLQNKYDRYRELRTPQWYLDLTNKIWDKLDDKVKDFLNRFVTEAVANFDNDFAKELIGKIVAALKQRLAL